MLLWQGLLRVVFVGLLPAFFFSTILHPELPSPLSRIPFAFPTPHPMPKFSWIPLPVWWSNPVSRRENFAFSRIPHYISVNSRISRIPFQTLYSLTRPRGMELERNEKYCNFYCSSSITLVFALFNPVLCGDRIFSSIIPKFTSYPGSSPKWSETRLARFLNATRM